MRRGFTLVELVVVMVILGLLALVAFPAVLKVINDSKASAYEDQVLIIEKAAKEWGVSNPTKLPDVNIDDGNCTIVKAGSQVTSISIDTLINSGYLSSDEVKNPKNGQKMNGEVNITFVCSKDASGKYIKNSGQYVYSYNLGAD